MDPETMRINDLLSNLEILREASIEDRRDLADLFKIYLVESDPEEVESAKDAINEIVRNEPDELIRIV